MVRATLLSALAALAGCSAEAPIGAPSPQPRHTPQAEPAIVTLTPSTAWSAQKRGFACPTERSAARVAAQPVEGGAALVFVTTPGDAAVLRRRVSALSLPPNVTNSSFRTDNIGNGIRLVFESESPARVGPLREALDGFAREIAQRCGLMLALPEPPEPVRPEPSASDPTTGAPSPKPDTDPEPPKPEEGDKSKPRLPENGKKNGSAPKPPPSDQAPPSPPKGSASALPDPFKPPPPNLPSPPQNPF